MADGNPYYIPKQNFFEEFSKGIGLGLSLRQASDRAKLIELQTQKQKLELDKFNQQSQDRQTLRDLAGPAPGTPYMQTNPGLTAEAQANPDFAGSGFTPLSVGEEVTKEPTMANIAQWLATRSGDPKVLQGILESQRKDAPPQFFDIPGGGTAVQGNNVHVVNPASARGGVADQIVRELATNPATGAFDPIKAQEIYKGIRTNPQGPESRIMDYVFKRNSTGVTDPAMEKSIGDYQNIITGRAAARGRGEQVGREQGLQEIVQQRIERLTREEIGKNAGRPLPDSAQTAVTAMQDGILIASKLKDEFTPQERAKYVGFVRLPATRLAQIIKGDPRFAEFNALLKRSEGTAFGEGGKQLTGIEKDVVFGYIPTGKELSLADFEAKIDQAINMGEQRIRNRYEVARAGKGSPGAPIPALNRPGAKPGAKAPNAMSEEEYLKEVLRNR